MTTKSTIKKFFKTLAPVVQEIYSTRKTSLPSVCLAQAALESGYNLNAKTLFGIKGTGDSLTTKEFVDGKWITVQDSTGACKGANTAFDGSASIALSMPSKGKFVDGLKLGDGSTSNATKNSIEFYTTSTTSAGAKIVAYSDRIEFVFA